VERGTSVYKGCAPILVPAGSLQWVVLVAAPRSTPKQACSPDVARLSDSGAVGVVRSTEGEH
jgi:hypothetical protein